MSIVDLETLLKGDVSLRKVKRPLTFCASQWPPACVTFEIMETVQIRFWGVRGSVPAPGRATMRFGGNTACLEIRTGKDLIICDAGTGIRELGLALERRSLNRPITAHILLSHLHWDHYMGLPFFAPLYRRQDRFVVYGPMAGRKAFGVALSRAMSPPYFPLPISSIPAKMSFKTVGSRPFQIGKVRVVPRAVNHPGGAIGWRFEFPNGKSLVHITDNEPGLLSERASIVEWMRDADVLIHDAQYTPNNYKSHIGWGHSPFTYPIGLAAEANIKRLFLFHFDPSDDDAHLVQVYSKARSIVKNVNPGVSVKMAKEGTEFTL